MIPKAEGIHSWYPPSGSGRMAVNLARYATCEAGKGWSAVLGAGETLAAAFSGAWGYAGWQSFYVKLKATGAATSAWMVYSDSTPVTAGRTYTVGRRINLISRGSKAMLINVNWLNAKSEFLSATSVEVNPPLGESRTQGTVVAPAGAAYMQVFFGHSGSAFSQLQPGETFECYGTMMQIEEGPELSADFPTESQLLIQRAVFTGTAHESTSTLELPAIELGRAKTDLGAVLWPRFELVRVTGLSSTGEAEANSDRPPGAAREIPRRSERRGKTVTYEGVLKAQNLVELREAEALFAASFDDLEGEGRMDAIWHPLLVAAEPALAAVPPKFFEARALDAVIIDVQDGQNFWRSFVVAVRMSDRHYFDEASSHTVTLTNANTNYDFT